MAFQKKPVEDFIGRGIILPLEVEKGTVPLRTGVDLIRSSIRIILNWPKFSRFYLEEFGTQLSDQLEEPNDYMLRQAIQQYVKDSIQQWEKRIELREVQVDSTNTSIHLQLRYDIISNQEADNYIFPFYEKN